MIYNMSGRLFTLHRFSARRISGCALAALTALSASVNTEAWTVASQFNQNQSASKLRMSTATEACASTFTVAQFLCRSDNYGYLLHDPSTGATAAIDTPSARTYKEELESRGWTLTHILNTHHHGDHTDGNIELKQDGVTIIGPINEKQKIPGIDTPVGDGDTVQFGKFKAIVMDAGGHTKGHVAYYFPEQSSVFVGDSLFSLGCGRMFEGTPTQFWASLERLRALPDDTIVYW
jgi:hydroxyacylglutathione hydrolase